jgi:hypothetical protein
MIVREAQIKKLEKAAVENFVLDMFQHCREFSPYLCKTLKEEELEEAIKEGLSRAEKHGFDQRGPVRLYLDLMIVFGSSFDTDPQYPWAAEILAQTEELTQMQRADALHEKTADYLEKVDGEKNEYTLKALEDLSVQIRSGLDFRRSTFGADMLRLMKEIHPRKYDETGEESLKKLISACKAKGLKQYGFQEARSIALMVVLGFAFGHQFDNDPFLCWISRTLSKDDFETPEHKADELERRALIWLDAVLKNAREGA